jgi:hypothetical protein
MNEDGVAWIGTFPSHATSVVFSRVRGEDRDHDDDRRD